MKTELSKVSTTDLQVELESRESPLDKNLKLNVSFTRKEADAFILLVAETRDDFVYKEVLKKLSKRIERLKIDAQNQLAKENRKLMKENKELKKQLEEYGIKGVENGY